VSAASLPGYFIIVNQFENINCEMYLLLVHVNNNTCVHLRCVSVVLGEEGLVIEQVEKILVMRILLTRLSVNIFC
jgi:hypothetical protein